VLARFGARRIHYVGETLALHHYRRWLARGPLPSWDAIR